MTFTQLIEWVYWPATALGLFLIFAPGMSRLEQPWLRRRAYLACLAWTPTLLLIFFLFNHSVRLLLAQDFIAVAFGLLILRWASQKPRAGAFRRWAAALMGLGFLVMGAWYIIGDYLLPRHDVVGTVDHFTAGDFRRYAHKVYLGKESYLITADLLPSLQIGQRVRLEVGRGSGSVFRIGDPSSP